MACAPGLPVASGWVAGTVQQGAAAGARRKSGIAPAGCCRLGCRLLPPRVRVRRRAVAGAAAAPAGGAHLPHDVPTPTVGVHKGEAEPCLRAARRGLHLLHQVRELAAGRGGAGRAKGGCRRWAGRAQGAPAAAPPVGWPLHRQGRAEGRPQRKAARPGIGTHGARGSGRSRASAHRSVASIQVYTCTSSLGSFPRRAKSSSWWCAPSRGNTRSSSGQTCGADGGSWRVEACETGRSSGCKRRHAIIQGKHAALLPKLVWQRVPPLE